MSDSENQFVAQGITRYADAKATVESFETLLLQRIVDKVTRFDATVFAPADKVIAKATQDALGYYVWATRWGTLGESTRSPAKQVHLELGVWWQDGQVRYYGGFLDAENKGLDLTTPPTASGIEMLPWSQKKRRLSIDASKGLPLDEGFLRLVDALAAAV